MSSEGMLNSSNDESAPRSSHCSTLVPLDDETRWILGRPNFWCASVAQVLREDGHAIKTKAEEEQAAVIHWLLNLYLQHGDQWRDVAQQETKRIKDKVASKVDA